MRTGGIEMRNIDKIKQMTIDEMATFLDKISFSPCNYCVFKINECTKDCEKGFKYYLLEVDNDR